jgi:hypothetical protein
LNNPGVIAPSGELRELNAIERNIYPKKDQNAIHMVLLRLGVLPRNKHQ